MSRGFVKEDDLELAGTDVPERPISEHTNYVTPTGALALQTWAESLSAEHEALKKNGSDDALTQNKIAEIERDLRYVQARLDSAILVDPASQSKETALFGAEVEVEDEHGEILTFHIVGEDEADASINKVSWGSPLAKALIGHKVGESVVWKRPAGDVSLEILEIR